MDLLSYLKRRELALGLEQMRNKTRRDRRWLSLCVCVWAYVCENKSERGFGVLVELLSSLWALLSSPLVAALMRSFTGGEKRGRSLLEKGGVDEIITQLSESLSGPRAVPSVCLCVCVCTYSMSAVYVCVFEQVCKGEHLLNMCLTVHHAFSKKRYNAHF